MLRATENAVWSPHISYPFSYITNTSQPNYIIVTYLLKITATDSKHTNKGGDTRNEHTTFIIYQIDYTVLSSNVY